MSKLLVIFSFIITVNGHSQSPGDPTKSLPRAEVMDNYLRSGPKQNGGIIIHQSPEFQMLSLRFKQEQSHVKLRVYKVQIYLGQRSTAEDVLRIFSSAYPEIQAALDYQPPNFKVRVGNFRSHLEADKFLREIKPEYPGSYIVQDE